jgi:tetratricopeptide (TPR) repeat protein
LPGPALLIGLVLCLAVPGGATAQSILDSLRRVAAAQQAYMAARALHEARDYEGAREKLVEVLALDPTHDDARALLGWTEYALGEYKSAIITFKSGIQRQPDRESLHAGLGWSRLRLRRHHLATEAFRAALDRNPDYVDALIGLGTAQFELGRYETALPPLQTAVRRLTPLVGGEPSDLGEVRAKTAWTLYYLGRHKDALALFEQGIRAAPDWHGLHNGLGWCYLRLGEKARARAAFQRALGLKPDYEDAREGLRQSG